MKINLHKYKSIWALAIVSFFLHSCAQQTTNKKNADDEAGQTTPDNINTFNSPIPTPIRLVVLGDSISTGVFADSKLEGEVDGTFLDSIHSLIPDIASVLSIITNTSSEQFTHEDLQEQFGRPNLTAWNGDESWSHVNRLKDRGHDVEAINLAVVGDRIEDATSQLDQLEQEYQQGNFEKANYIVLQFGANDFCGGTIASNFEQSLTQTLDQINTSHPDAVVLVLGLPAIDKVFTIGDTTVSYTHLTLPTIYSV